MLDETTVESVNAESPEVTVASASSDIDYETELAKVREERDNYKKGMLLAKGKLKASKEIEPVDDEDEQDIASIVARTVKAELAASRHDDLNKREEDLVQKLIRENKELKLATRTRSNMTSNSSGAKSTDTEPNVTTSAFTAEQLAYFKAKNIDPKEVLKNMNR